MQTYGIYADFSLGGKVYQDVEDTLKDLDVGILGQCISEVDMGQCNREVDIGSVQ